MIYVRIVSTLVCCVVIVFVFNDTATTEIYTDGHTLARHDALPISGGTRRGRRPRPGPEGRSAPWCTTTASVPCPTWRGDRAPRSEEHTSELPSLMRTSYAVFCSKNRTS